MFIFASLFRLISGLLVVATKSDIVPAPITPIRKDLNSETYFGCWKGRSAGSFEVRESERWVEFVAVGALVVKASTFDLAGSTTFAPPPDGSWKIPEAGFRSDRTWGIPVPSQRHSAKAGKMTIAT